MKATDQQPVTNERISIRPAIRNLQPSATLLINERSKALQAAGRQIYRLGFGQSPFPIPESVVKALQDHAHEKDYLPVKGLPALRRVVAQFNQQRLGIDCDLEDILIGPGSKELILGLQIACNAPLLLPSPSWVSYGPQAQIAQNAVHWINTREEDQWLLTAGQLEQELRHKVDGPAILLLNYPSNPVGSTYTPDQLRALVSVARQYNLLVIADEIYGELTFEGKHTSIAAHYPEGTIISSGLSKWCGAGGWRLGTFTFPPTYRPLLEAMAMIASESFSAVNAPVQYAAVTAFTYGPDIQSYVNTSRRILQAVSQYVFQTLTATGLTMPAPAGGFYLFPNFERWRQMLQKRDVLTSQQLCEVLLEETGIALLPGVAFGRPDEELSCRLSYVDFDGATALAAARKYGEAPLDEAFLSAYCPKIVEAMRILSHWLSD